MSLIPFAPFFTVDLVALLGAALGKPGLARRPRDCVSSPEIEKVTESLLNLRGHHSASVRFSNYEPYGETLSVIIQHVDIKSQTAEKRYQPPFLFRHVTRCRRRSFRHGSHCSIGPGPERCSIRPGQAELGQV